MLIGKYKLFRVIGDGSFSTVKLGFQIFTNERAAVKIVNKDTLGTQRREELLGRLDILRRLDHPGIIKCLDFVEDPSAYYIVFEYCGGGELFDFITSRTRVEEPLAKRLFKQILLAVEYMHSQNVVHRDLKPENLLLTDRLSVKLIDFGLANAHADEPLHDRCGSACYIAPEALTRAEYMGKPADIWALGVILYALVDGSLPWDYRDPDRMMAQITTGDFPMPRAISPHCQDLIRGILNPDPDARFSLDAMLTHPWLFGVGNVFPLPKMPAIQREEPHLDLSYGGSSATVLKPTMQVTIRRLPVTALETIFEEEGMQTMGPPPEVDRRARSRAAQPRSISLNSVSVGDGDEDGSDDGRRGPILSQTISHRDPQVVAAQFESALMSMGVSYRKTSSLMFHMSATELQVTAEVCRLAGFRSVHIISFRRVKGDSWTYAQFVQRVLEVFKPP
jgi:serine/threonine protein kinase